MPGERSYHRSVGNQESDALTNCARLEPTTTAGTIIEIPIAALIHEFGYLTGRITFYTSLEALFTICREQGNVADLCSSA